MSRRFLIGLLEGTALALTLAAVFSELEKPPEKRKWHGKVGFVPYDLRPPTAERVADSFWNPYQPHVFHPAGFGFGWSINFHALLENLGLMISPGASEEDYLMPTRSIKEVLKDLPTRIKV